MEVGNVASHTGICITCCYEFKKNSSIPFVDAKNLQQYFFYGPSRLLVRNGEQHHENLLYNFFDVGGMLRRLPLGRIYVTCPSHQQVTAILYGFDSTWDFFFRTNHLEVAPQYASLLLGISNTFGSLPGIISPTLTGLIVQHQVSILVFLYVGTYHVFLKIQRIDHTRSIVRSLIK